MNTDKEIPGNVCPTCGKREWGVCSNAWHLLHDKELTPELIYLKSIEAQVNEHGVYVYTSTNGSHSINLEIILEEYGQQEEASGYERGLLAGRKENRYKATDQFYTGIDRGLEIAQLKEANEWISVEKGRPIHKQRVSVYFNRKNASKQLCISTEGFL